MLLAGSLLMMPGACAQAPAQPAGSLRLADLLAEAERVHPSIRAAEGMVTARSARVVQARALPDPQISAGYTGSIAPFKTQKNDPSSFRVFGVMQELPYPGKRDLRAKVASKEADAEQWNVEAVRRRILGQVRQVYFEMWGAGRELEILSENKKVLESIAQIAAERYQVGQGMQQDVLRAQLEVTRLLPRVVLLTQRQRTLAAELNSLLLRPADTPIGALEAVEKSPLPFTIEELLGQVAEGAPDVRRQGELVEQGQLAGQLAKKEFYPDFSVGWEYMNRTSGMPEMFGLRFTMNLPIFNKARRREAVTEAAALESSARHMREAVQNEIQFKVREQYLLARTAEELMSLYAQALKPQAALTFESALAGYRTGKIDMTTVVLNILALLEAESGYSQEMTKYQQALARIQEVTGRELIP